MNSVYPQVSNYDPQTEPNVPTNSEIGTFNYPSLEGVKDQPNITKFDLRELEEFESKYKKQTFRQLSLGLKRRQTENGHLFANEHNLFGNNEVEMMFKINKPITKQVSIPMQVQSKKDVNNTKEIVFETEEGEYKTRNTTPNAKTKKQAENEKSEMRKLVADKAAQIFKALKMDKDNRITYSEAFRGICALFQTFRLTKPNLSVYENLLKVFEHKKKGLLDRFEYVSFCCLITGY